MKEVKAFVHRGRVADIVRALERDGHRRLSVIDVRGLLRAIGPREQTYSVELGERVTDEVRIEVFCEDVQVDPVVGIIRTNGRTGQATAGWVYVSTVNRAEPIGERDP